MPKRKSITAAELMRELEANPQWVAQRAAKEARSKERAKRCDEDEAGLLRDLAGVGVICGSVYDFVRGGSTPAAAFPVLVAHLDMPHMPAIRDGIIRALTRAEAKPLVFDKFMRLYSSDTDPNLRWVIADALSQIAKFEEVSHLAGKDFFHELFDAAAP